MQLPGMGAVEGASVDYNPGEDIHVARRKPINPFYLMLLFAGCAFAITACAYGVMTVRQLHSSRAPSYDRVQAESPSTNIGDSELGPYAGAGNENFNQLVDLHGPTLMVIELILLGVGTFGAIAYDQHLDGKDQAGQLAEQHSTPKEST